MLHRCLGCLSLMHTFSYFSLVMRTHSKTLPRLKFYKRTKETRFRGVIQSRYNVYLVITLFNRWSNNWNLILIVLLIDNWLIAFDDDILPHLIWIFCPFDDLLNIWCRLTRFVRETREDPSTMFEPGTHTLPPSMWSTPKESTQVVHTEAPGQEDPHQWTHSMMVHTVNHFNLGVMRLQMDTS